MFCSVGSFARLRGRGVRVQLAPLADRFGLNLRFIIVVIGSTDGRVKRWCRGR